MAEDTDRQTRLTEVAGIAVAIEASTGCPASMLVAQWAVESRWGAKPAGQANYFGMKENSRDPNSCAEETKEFVDGKLVEEELLFADYVSLADSARDYALLITKGEPYHAAWEQYSKDRDLGALIVAVAAKYATDPGYGALVGLIARQANVTRALALARQAVA